MSLALNIDSMVWPVMQWDTARGAEAQLAGRILHLRLSEAVSLGAVANSFTQLTLSLKINTATSKTAWTGTHNPKDNPACLL